MKKTYLVTGASGFLGSHIAEFLIERKKKVILFDIKRSKFFKKNFFVVGDLNNLQKLNKYTKNVNTILIIF